MIEMSCEIAIVGAGPSGLATACTLQKAGYSVILLEKGPIANAIAKFPTYMMFHSTAPNLELNGFPLIITQEKPTRREYLNYLLHFVRKMELDVRTGHEVTDLAGEIGHFRLMGHTRQGDEFIVGAHHVVLATGTFDSPIRLNVPGEDLPKCSHYFTEVHPYFGSKTLIVGGGNSAADTALELFRSGIDVTICHRRAEFKKKLKFWVRPDLENRIRAGEIKALMSTRVVEIKPKRVLLQTEGAEPFEIENDYVLALTGYGPDSDFLSRFGVTTAGDDDRPVIDSETLESSRPGVYLIGEVLTGKVSGEIFIENSRTHGDQILAHLRAAPKEHSGEQPFEARG